MKLRIQENSLRLRLSKSEVSLIGNGETVEETLDFGGEPAQRLIYALVPVENTEELTAAFDSGRITIFLPKSQANEWARTDQIGIKAAKSISNERVLHILIEKDFTCLNPRPDVEDRDAFSNPSSKKISNSIELKALD